MRFRIGLSFLCLLALCALPPLAAADPAARSVVRPGLMTIALDPGAFSVLPIDTQALRAGLCSGILPVDGVGTISPRGECDLSVSVSPPPGIDVLVNHTASDSSLRVSAQPQGFAPWQGGASVSTSCGLWDVSMVLDPALTQPVSELALERSATDPTQGVFAGTLKLAVRYRFYNRNTGAQLKKPAVLSLELSGHWAAAPEGDPISSGSGTGGIAASNLVLFAGVSQGEGVGFPSCVSWGGLDCKVCFSATPEDIEKLTPSFNP